MANNSNLMFRADGGWCEMRAMVRFIAFGICGQNISGDVRFNDQKCRKDSLTVSCDHFVGCTHFYV